MNGRALYDEIDPYAARWLRNLIGAGHIAPGVVDERSIVDIDPSELAGYTQCHFFAGIGGWSYALRLAGWPDGRPVWTGSCPCQPFSQAGAQRGSEDERHLWPAFFRLVRERRPGRVFGEQVAGAAGLAWLDHVYADLEGAGCAAAAANLCAAGAGAPHIRQRLYWVADSKRGAAERRGYDLAGAPGSAEGEAWERQRIRDELGAGDAVGTLADADGRRTSAERQQRSVEQRQRPADGGTDGMGDTSSAGLPPCKRAQLSGAQRHDQGRAVVQSGGAWSEVEWLACSDGKARPTKPGIFPLAHGVSNRVGRLRAYGNAIVPQVAAAFIGAMSA